ncbi:MAG: hypothetical protein HY553_00415 [Elusimicrobia bacterium]|nr:hypothetical protein [Elusimicrobiota bacterium]
MASEIVGLSHLVLAVDDVRAAGGLLAGLGYRETGRVDAAPCPPERAAAVSGPQGATFDMALLERPEQAPPIELLRDAAGPSAGPARHFEGVLSTGERPGPAALRSVLSNSASALAPGLRRLDSSGDAKIYSVAVRSGDPEGTLELWRLLGVEPAAVEPGLWRVDVRGFRPNNRVSLYVLRGDASAPEGALNQRGMVCVSFFCRDADRLRERLAAAGRFTSAGFTTAPFGRALRIFFARSPGGELYEFVSAAR